MKAKEVMQILNISRMTLSSYVQKGHIEVTKLPGGQYFYNPQSVFKLIKKDKRQNIIYARVSTYKQKGDLNKQIRFIKKYCKDNKFNVDTIYSEVTSGLDFDRPQFSKLLNDVLNYRIHHIFISNKDRLTRFSFSTLEHI